MPRRLPTAVCFASLAVTAATQLCAQESIGTVATDDARVSGGLEVRGERATLLSNASVTAYERTAPIELTRGGEVLVCSTSQFHLLHSGAGQALTFGLDRGAIEIHSTAQTADVLQTPDLRFSFAGPGQLDLRLRVTSNGDTCVDNAGASAPTISVSDVFSDATYHLQPGQHVLFEHGSLREVVDSERSPCGCPPLPSPTLGEPATSTPLGATSPAQASARNPFPSAVSQGLAPDTKPANDPSDGSHVQVASTLAYGANTEAKPTTNAPAPAAPTKQTSLAPPATPPGAHDIFHSIGHFFRRLFGGSSGSKPKTKAST